MSPFLRQYYPESQFNITDISYHGLIDHGLHEGEVFFEDGTVISIRKKDMNEDSPDEYYVEQVFKDGKDITTEDLIYEYEGIREIDIELSQMFRKENPDEFEKPDEWSMRRLHYLENL